MKIWELHSMILPQPILTTPDGHANVEGLILTEKAYLLAVRDFRPGELVDLVLREGPAGAASRLARHYDARAALDGRGLSLGRGQHPGPMLRRSDEQPAPVAGADRTLIRP
jgi:hypothetical protein